MRHKQITTFNPVGRNKARFMEISERTIQIIVFVAIRRPNSFEHLREYVAYPATGTTSLQLAEIAATEI